MVAYRIPGPEMSIAGGRPAGCGTQALTYPPARGVLGEAGDLLALDLGDNMRAFVLYAAGIGGPCSYLTPLPPTSTDTVSAPSVAFDRLRRGSPAASISEPRPVAAQLWFRHGTSYAALEQEITIGSQVLRVIQPTAAAAAGKNLPTTAQIAESLRALPAAQRAATHAIFVSPVRSARSRGINIVAAEGGAGQIIFFPLSGSQSQSMFDNRTMHEAGHNYQTVFWRSPAGPGEWDHAADLDGNSPSPYAATGALEDFCEFIIFYNTAKGTQCQFSAMQVYPHRWAKMDAYLLR